MIGLDDLSALGEKHLAENPDAVTQRVAAIEPDQLATLIYTSGTTGRPKGVRLRHSVWTYEGAAIQAQGILDETDLQFLWLPMAHSFGKVLLSAQLACGFATAVDGRVDRIIDNLAVVKPTFMGAAPRIFEKAHARIVTMQAAEGGAKEKIFNQAFAVGQQVDALEREGKPVPLPLKLAARAVRQAGLQQGPRPLRWPGPLLHLRLRRAQPRHRRVVPRRRHPDPRGLRHDRERRRRLRQPPRRLQDGHRRPGDPRRPRCASARATRSSSRARTSWRATTTCPRRPPRRSPRTAGCAPATRASLDADGFLTITGRIKELFKTSGGKYIAPPAIEAKFKAVCPYASQFMVFGNERNYCVALVTLDPDAIVGWAKENGVAARLRRGRRPTRRPGRWSAATSTSSTPS